MIFAALAVLVACGSLQAYEARRCAACRATCMQREIDDDVACCRGASGTRTTDFCVSDRPEAYKICAKGLADARSTCESACNQTVCAK